MLDDSPFNVPVPLPHLPFTRLAHSDNSPEVALFQDMDLPMSPRIFVTVTIQAPVEAGLPFILYDVVQKYSVFLHAPIDLFPGDTCLIGVKGVSGLLAIKRGAEVVYRVGP